MSRRARRKGSHTKYHEKTETPETTGDPEEGVKQEYKYFLNYTSDVSAKILVSYKGRTVFQNFGKGLKFSNRTTK
jgi:hypothetical protein